MLSWSAWTYALIGRRTLSFAEQPYLRGSFHLNGYGSDISDLVAVELLPAGKANIFNKNSCTDHRAREPRPPTHIEYSSQTVAPLRCPKLSF